MNALQCSVFHELASTFEYRLLVLVKAILCIAGTLRLLIQWRKYGLGFLVHTNTKILFRFYVVLNVIVSAIFGSIFAYDFMRLFFGCLLLDFRWILLSRGVGISSLFAMQHVMLVLSLERLYSAIYPAHFEKHSSKLLSFSLALIAVSIVVCIEKGCNLQIVATLAYTLFEVSDSGRLFQEPKIENFMGRVAVSSCVSLLTLCLDCSVNILRKPATGISLAISYQRSENRRIVLILLPIELSQIVLGFSGSFALFMFNKMAVNSTPFAQQLFLELVTYVVFFPLILSYLIQHSLKQKTVGRPANRSFRITQAQLELMNECRPFCSIVQDLSQSLAYHLVSALKGASCVAGAVRIVMHYKHY
ncbi:hypothetical protein PRIPAC_80625, partial [Pristionchus pacificus]|uniref:Uncharacterized protein n=1 Tax=Pristionchus pacificus TaxID=54126 RepID=A0A2A6CNQ0_PRIPA